MPTWRTRPPESEVLGLATRLVRGFITHKARRAPGHGRGVSLKFANLASAKHCEWSQSFQKASQRRIFEPPRDSLAVAPPRAPCEDAKEECDPARALPDNVGRLRLRRAMIRLWMSTDSYERRGLRSQAAT